MKSVSVIHHPLMLALQSRKKSFRDVESNSSVAKLATEGFFKIEDDPNMLNCFCCGLEIKLRKCCSLSQLCSSDVHKICSIARSSCFCAYREIFKSFKTTDAKISDKIKHETKSDLLGLPNSEPIAVQFYCHQELLVTGDESFWETVVNYQTRDDDVYVHPQGIALVNSSIDETDCGNPSIDAIERVEFSGNLDFSEPLRCPRCPLNLSFVRVG